MLLKKIYKTTPSGFVKRDFASERALTAKLRSKGLVNFDLDVLDDSNDNYLDSSTSSTSSTSHSPSTNTKQQQKQAPALLTPFLKSLLNEAKTFIQQRSAKLFNIIKFSDDNSQSTASSTNLQDQAVVETHSEAAISESCSIASRVNDFIEEQKQVIHNQYERRQTSMNTSFRSATLTFNQTIGSIAQLSDSSRSIRFDHNQHNHDRKMRKLNNQDNMTSSIQQLKSLNRTHSIRFQAINNALNNEDNEEDQTHNTHNNDDTLLRVENRTNQVDSDNYESNKSEGNNTSNQSIKKPKRQFMIQGMSSMKAKQMKNHGNSLERRRRAKEKYEVKLQESREANNSKLLMRSDDSDSFILQDPDILLSREDSFICYSASNKTIPQANLANAAAAVGGNNSTLTASVALSAFANQQKSSKDQAAANSAASQNPLAQEAYAADDQSDDSISIASSESESSSFISQVSLLKRERSQPQFDEDFSVSSIHHQTQPHALRGIQEEDEEDDQQEEQRRDQQEDREILSLFPSGTASLASNAFKKPLEKKPANDDAGSNTPTNNNANAIQAAALSNKNSSNQQSSTEIIDNNSKAAIEEIEEHKPIEEVVSTSNVTVQPAILTPVVTHAEQAPIKESTNITTTASLFATPITATQQQQQPEQQQQVPSTSSSSSLFSQKIGEPTAPPKAPAPSVSGGLFSNLTQIPTAAAPSKTTSLFSSTVTPTPIEPAKPAASTGLFSTPLTSVAPTTQTTAASLFASTTTPAAAAAAATTTTLPAGGLFNNLLQTPQKPETTATAAPIQSESTLFKQTAAATSTISASAPIQQTPLIATPNPLQQSMTQTSTSQQQATTAPQKNLFGAAIESPFANLQNNINGSSSMSNPFSSNANKPQSLSDLVNSRGSSYNFNNNISNNLSSNHNNNNNNQTSSNNNSSGLFVSNPSNSLFTPNPASSILISQFPGQTNNNNNNINSGNLQMTFPCQNNGFMEIDHSSSNVASTQYNSNISNNMNNSLFNSIGNQNLFQSQITMNVMGNNNNTSNGLFNTPSTPMMQNLYNPNVSNLSQNNFAAPQQQMTSMNQGGFGMTTGNIQFFDAPAISNPLWLANNNTFSNNQQPSQSTNSLFGGPSAQNQMNGANSLFSMGGSSSQQASTSSNNTRKSGKPQKQRI